MSQRLLAAFWIFAGTMHFVVPRRYESIMPPYIPRHKEMVQLSGVAEIAGGVMVLIPGMKRIARWWILGVLLAVYPANIYMATNPDDIEGIENVPRWLLWARLPVQFLFAAHAWRATD